MSSLKGVDFGPGRGPISIKRSEAGDGRTTNEPTDPFTYYTELNRGPISVRRPAGDQSTWKTTTEPTDPYTWYERHQS
jgi:hypothetical protein